MARIAGVDLPRDKRVEIGLTYIFGIGRKSANDILAATGINPDTRVRDLTEDEVSKLREHIDHNYVVEGDLRRTVAFDIKRLIEIGLYKLITQWNRVNLKLYTMRQNTVHPVRITVEHSFMHVHRLDN